MKPSWSDAPEWANWLAQDSDGVWHWFSEQPKDRVSSGTDDYYGYWRVYGAVAEAGKTDLVGDWDDTLEERPR